MRKYDGRVNSGNFTKGDKRGPKPQSRKDLAGRRSVTHLREIDAHKSPVQLFQEAIAAKNYSLAWQIRCDVETRALGRPYVAINPAENKQAATVNNDNRLQNAIINLIPGGAPKPKRKAKLLVAESEVVSEDKAMIPNESGIING